MSTILDLQNDVKGTNTFARPFSTQIFTATLGAATHSTITVPSNFARWVAYFKYESPVNVYVSINGTAAVPAGATFAASVSELNPDALQVNAGDIIDVITATASTDVCVSLYALS